MSDLEYTTRLLVNASIKFEYVSSIQTGHLNFPSIVARQPCYKMTAQTLAAGTLAGMTRCSCIPRPVVVVQWKRMHVNLFK
jgi:hypothetical protein